MQPYNHIIENIHQLDTPALVVYPQQVVKNIQQTIQIVGDENRLRPHIKTAKSAEVVNLLMSNGISKFKCATIAEAELLGSCYAPDVLLAYQPIGKKLARFIQLIQAFPDTKFSCLTDHLDAAKAQSAAFLSQNLQVPVYLDLNIGQNRTGITPESAFDLYENCENLEGLKVVGLHTYDGHISHPDLKTRTELCDKAFEKVEDLRAKILRGGKMMKIIAGGSPTFPIHAQRSDVECSPGTFVYWDKGYALSCPEQPFIPAALVVTRVISLPDSTKLCLDLGHKSIAAENELSKRVYFLNADLTPLSQSEEHLVVDAGVGHGFKIGDVLYGIPHHICPTVALYESAFTVENGQLASEWRTVARDRRIKI